MHWLPLYNRCRIPEISNHRHSVHCENQSTIPSERIGSPRASFIRRGKAQHSTPGAQESNLGHWPQYLSLIIHSEAPWAHLQCSEVWAMHTEHLGVCS